MRQQAIATTLVAACITGPLSAQGTNTALETLGTLINWSGAPGSAPRGLTNISVNLDDSDCVLFFDVNADEAGSPFSMRLSAAASVLDPNQVFVWEQGDTQRLNIYAQDGSDPWTFSSQVASTSTLFAEANEMITSGDVDGTCTADACTLNLSDRPLDLPLPSLTTEDDIVATTVALQTLITQCGGSADTADN